MTLGQRIRDIRKRKKITQDELAKMLNYSYASSISYIETGQRQINAKKLPILAEALGVSIEELLGGSLEDIFFAQNIVKMTISNEVGETNERSNEFIQ
ncbi:helix-turn-helix domain-containing protein [Bacillus sp. AFS075034]|uniref:helix-turn-helix domain-containing protein n=1 Tax=Bacillus sp. AFS075034 TaxID=2034281 RepID=UPI000BF9939E|nr:helix-turn-helix transcriptional regulator [Bacillus sp. AFS075034]PFW60803.1 transcriptional regulator [Bacillus sp. AFS075034]